MVRVAYAFILLLFFIPTANAQFFQCPAGSYPVSGGGGLMCRCADGSWASIYGCNQSFESQNVYCGNNSYCPAGTQCCGNQCCHAGSYCSATGCIPNGAISCGSGYCDAGSLCVNQDGKYICPTPQRYAEIKAYSVYKWLKENNASLRGSFTQRDKIAREYVRDNAEVKRQIASIINQAGIMQACGGDGRCTAIVTTALDIGSDYEDFSSGRTYEGTLHVVNQVSAKVLAFIAPYGGTIGTALDIGGAVATAYVYGFFWGQ